MMKIHWTAFLLGALLLTALPASGGNKSCYWNAPGLPYSQKPPPGTGEATDSGGPLAVTHGMLLAAPHLLWKYACLVIDEKDLAIPREIYRRWGCTATSSLGRMIEGLADGGVYVSEIMRSYPYGVDENREEFKEFCTFVDAVDPECFRNQPIETGPNDKQRIEAMNARIAKKFPQCVEKWPEMKSYGKWLMERDFFNSEKLRAMARRDRALLESAAVE